MSATRDEYGETCSYGWAEGCEYHMPDDRDEWCDPCRTRLSHRTERRVRAMSDSKCICTHFKDTDGYRIADLTCPVHGVNGTHPGDGYWDDEQNDGSTP